jgi:anaerobic selenocysteine-containing dehydrogenase
MLSEDNRLQINKIPGKQTGIEIKKTICAICEGGATSCGVNAYIKDGNVIKVEGMKEFPQNRGTLCAKGNANRQYIYNKDRLLSPMRRTGNRKSGNFEKITWAEAYDTIAEKLLSIKAESGPEAVVFGVGFTKWLRPFAQRLAISFGSPNFATESSTCFYATRIASKLTYGQWGGPDIKNSECLLVWSRNVFNSGTPGAKKLIAARKNGLKIIEVSPAVTHLTRYADIRLGLRPGTDGALALGMANVIIAEGLYDKDFVSRWTIGFDDYKAYVEEFTPEKTEAITGIPAALIVHAARLFANAKAASIMTSASPTVHHTNGVQNHRALICLSGLTGNFDSPGGNYVVPETWLHVCTGIQTRQHDFIFSNDLSVLAPRVGQEEFPVWSKLVNEAQSMWLPYQIESGNPYPIRALIAFGYNQRMWPGNDFFSKSLEKLEFFVNVELFMTDTARIADIVLPACTSFERSELRFYPGNHVIYTQPAIAPLGESKPDSEIIFDLAKRIVPEDALMQKGYHACLDWILEPSGLTVEELRRHPSGLTVTDVQMPPFRKYEAAGFQTPSGKMEFTSTLLKEAGFDPLPIYKEPVLSPVSITSKAKNYPLVLGTGIRLPMYVHSRTFRNTWDRRLHPHPTVMINSKDAAARGIGNDDDVILSTHRAQLKVKAKITDTIHTGVVNIFHGWPEIEVNQMIEPNYLDPISGFPGFKSLLCDIQKA